MEKQPFALSVSAAYDFCILLQPGAVWPGQMSEQRICKQMYRLLLFFLLLGRAITAVFVFAQHAYDCIAVTRKLGGGCLFLVFFPFFFF